MSRTPKKQALEYERTQFASQFGETFVGREETSRNGEKSNLFSGKGARWVKQLSSVKPIQNKEPLKDFGASCYHLVREKWLEGNQCRGGWGGRDLRRVGVRGGVKHSLGATFKH